MKFLRSRAARVAALALAALLSACDAGRNPFNPPPPGGGPPGSQDQVPPTVDVVIPDAQTPSVVVGDSVFIRARVRDDRRVMKVRFEAFAVRGRPELGTDTAVARFAAKEVDLSGAGYAVKDTTLDRFLLPTPDTLREQGIFVVVTATDSMNNRTADTARINLVGETTAPTVDILAPTAASSTVNVGDSLFVSARVGDNRKLARVTFEAFSMRGSPALGTAVKVPRYAAKEVDLGGLGRAVRDTVLSRFLLATPDTLREPGVLVVVTAVDSAGFTRSDTVAITIGGQGAAPLVTVLAPANNGTVNLGDSLLVRARVRDDRRLARVTFQAFSVRGNVAQGTATTVERYFSRTVDLSGSARAVTDTTLERSLAATRDTARESGVFVVVTAVDSSGYSRSDTVRINIGGAQAAPLVDIVLPDARTGTIAVGDSVFVRARVRDDRRLARVTFEGFAVRGSVALGTDTTVVRYASKEVNLAAGGRVVTDTLLDRFLLATSDTVRESGVFIVVTAVDSMGLSTSDTARVSIGGPRVQVTLPAGQDPRGGAELRVRVVAEDSRDLIASVRVRGSGAFAFDTTLSLPTPRASVDTVLAIDIPLAASGALEINASTVSGALQTGTAIPVTVQVRQADVDRTRPRTTFSLNVRERVEQRDSFEVTVTGADETRVDSVGVTVLALRRNGSGGRDTLRVYRGAGPVTTGTFRFQYADLQLSVLDTASVELEVTAWSKDSSGNCGAAVTPNTPQEMDCLLGAGGVVRTTSPGRLLTVFVARGATILRPGNGTSIVPDLVADSTYVYLSNYSSNRVELLPLGGTAYSGSVLVGSQPWGVSLSRNRDSLYVANSGGTNISVIGLDGSPREDNRILTRNERLFGVTFSVANAAVQSVTMYDYSDRPQFITQASNGLLVYSTKPTAAARDGTVRLYDPRKLRSEIFTGYVDRSTPGKATVVNADSAFHLPANSIIVCPRRRFGDTTDPACIAGGLVEVSDSLRTLRSLPANAAGGRYDTRLDIGAAIEDVGFADTTFVAASTDRRFVAVGEGVRQNARIPMFEALGDSMVLRGDVRDLISNSAERVIGLGLNFDGSLGVARGNEAYYFSSDLRRQGAVASGAPTGGVAMHPQGANYPSQQNALSFVSGQDAAGRPYVDVINSYNFRLIKRVYIRDAVVGALVVAPRAPSDPANVNLRIYALTTGGVLGLMITNQDLQ